jgi:hypothetical protein
LSMARVAAIRWIGVLALGLGLVSSGCQRKAPGPKECQRAVLRMVGVYQPDMLRVPQIKEAVDQITVDCLTTPYDRQMVRCLEEGIGARLCLAEFRARQRLPQMSTGTPRGVDPEGRF